MITSVWRLAGSRVRGLGSGVSLHHTLIYDMTSYSFEFIGGYEFPRSPLDPYQCGTVAACCTLHFMIGRDGGCGRRKLIPEGKLKTEN